MVVLSAKAMRICPTFAVIAVVVLASGCGGTKISPTAATQAGASHGSPPAAGAVGASRVIGRLAPSRFVVQPDIADPRCNGGDGVRLRGPFGGRKQAVGHEESVTVASGTIAGDSTLIAFTASGYEQGKSFAVLNSLTPPVCSGPRLRDRRNSDDHDSLQPETPTAARGLRLVRRAVDRRGGRQK
jgi:hypothetical protein